MSTATSSAGRAATGSGIEVAVVVAVVVTYDPDTARLQQLLEATRPQVHSLIIVDNGSNPERSTWLRQAASARGIKLIELGANRGIAAAQNIGLSHARQVGASHVLLLDHDSIPAATMVADLLQALATVRPAGRGIAAVGPRYLDERQDNPPPFIRVHGLRVHRCDCPSTDTIVEVDYLISSGSLIPFPTLDLVGGMAEELFIDYVDIEWGLRAGRMGFQSYGVCAAQMSHDLGDAPVSFMGRRVPVHTALRHYYHFRNAVWLYRSADLPLHWKCADSWRLLLKFGFYTLFGKPRMDHFRMMSRGMFDGLRGRMGRLECASGSPPGAFRSR